jgi:hypothetical protein
MVVCAVWIVLVLLSSSANAAETENVISRQSERNLPSYNYYNYYSKKSKSSKKSKGGYYSYYGSKGSKGGYYSYDYYSSKSDKKEKDCKSAKKHYNYYGDYDHCFDVPIDDGNSTDIEDIFSESKSYKSKGSKGSKGGYSYYSKSYKSKSDKKDKSDKKSKKPTMAPTRSPDIGFEPPETWNKTFVDAVDTGFLFYDPVTAYAWYAYNAGLGEDSLVSVSSAEAVDGDAFTVTTKKIVSETIGRICPIDTADDGQILEDLCIEISAPGEWTTVTSTKIEAAEACYGTVTGAIFKLAVVVKDTSQVLHLEDILVGSRMVVYDIVVAGKNGSSKEPIIQEVAYKGWKSVYGQPTINGGPSFSSDCKMVYATWLAPNDEGDGFTSVTIANDVESATKEGDSSEVWRLGTSGRLPGLTPSKDGKTLFSGINVPKDNTISSGGIISLSEKTGEIKQEFVLVSDVVGAPHNAFTNPIMDDSGNTYHVDSLLGLVKVDTTDLNDGPVWSAMEGVSEKDMTAVERQNGRHLNPLEMAFTAYKPDMDSNFTTIYGCGNNAVSKDDGVIALKTENGQSVWFSELDDIHNVEAESCSGITHDIVYGSSVTSPSGNAVHIARGNVVQALDSKNGKLLWTLEMGDKGHTTNFVLVSKDSIIAANKGTVVGVETIEAPPTKAPSPTTPTTPNETPSRSPTRRPLSTPSPVGPTIVIPVPDSPPSSASTLGLSYVAAVLSVLPLLLALLR